MKLCVYNSVCRSSQVYRFLIVLLVRADVDFDALSAREKLVSNVFHPRFTYPVRPQAPRPLFGYHKLTPRMQIFGEQEKLYGYENLRVNVSSQLPSYLPSVFLMLQCSCALLLALYDSIWLLNTLPNLLILPSTTLKSNYMTSFRLVV